MGLSTTMGMMPRRACCFKFDWNFPSQECWTSDSAVECKRARVFTNLRNDMTSLLLGSARGANLSERINRSITEVKRHEKIKEGRTLESICCIVPRFLQLCNAKIYMI